MRCLGENLMILLRSLCWKKVLPKVISLSLQSSVNCSALLLVMLAEPWVPMVDSIAWQFFNLRIEVSHQGFDVLFRDFINSVLVLIIYVVIISFHCWSMYLNYCDLDMPFQKMWSSYLFVDWFPTNQSFCSKCRFPGYDILYLYNILLNVLSKLLYSCLPSDFYYKPISSHISQEYQFYIWLFLS